MKLLPERDIVISALLIGDKKWLTQLLGNLLNNTLKFTQHGTVILNVNLMSLAVKHAVIDFSIIDTGIGIVPDSVEILFQSFRPTSQLPVSMAGRVWVLLLRSV